ncbi:hypothetical protein KCP78_13525 [Salmonella enterica subsp. enterica]|nr:hypothetical protein KCP78_13525 [Salmonella enterica subsp. enterica]
MAASPLSGNATHQDRFQRLTLRCVRCAGVKVSALLRQNHDNLFHWRLRPAQDVLGRRFYPEGHPRRAGTWCVFRLIARFHPIRMTHTRTGKFESPRLCWSVAACRTELTVR